MTRAPTSSRKVWWLDNGGSQSPQWGVWITKQSPVCCRWSRSCHSMDSILPVQNKDFTRDGKEFTKVPWAVAKAESYYSDNSLAFIKSCAELNCERWNFCSIATITIGWKMGGLVLWNAIAICEMQWLSVIRFQFNQDFISLARKYYLVSFLGMNWSRGEIWKGNILISDLEDLEKLDASEIYPRRINAKEVLISQKGDGFIFPVADGTAKLSGRDFVFPRTHSIARTNRKERRFQQRTSMWTGRVSTGRTNRWRWSPCRLLVNSRWR